MNRIINGYLKAFCEEKSISESLDESKQFECFVNYCIVHEFIGDDFDVWDITSQEDDQGIDGIIILIDGELATSVDEANSLLSRNKRNMPVDIYFIQSKTSEKYDRGEILKFGDGVVDFTKEHPSLPQGDFIRSQKSIFDLLFDHLIKISDGKPNIYLKYVCTSDNKIATEIDATKANIISNLNKTHLFNKVDFEYIGLNKLSNLWIKSQNTLNASLSTMSILSFPNMKDIVQAYLIIVSAKKYVENLLMDEDKKKYGNIYDENVRAFLGEDNPVNAEIKATLINPDSQNRFAILNNGITIISPEVKNMGTTISLSDYQIVNGCQTSNMLFENYDILDDNTFITVRIIQADNNDIISEIVKATNSQTKVENTQFLAFVSLFRKLEQYFNSLEDSNEEIKLYLERRLNQYKGLGIQQNRIFKTRDVCRAVESMYFDRPDAAGRNPTKMIADDIEKLTDDNNREIAYYAATLALYKINLLVRKGKILNHYTIYRWHILMIIKYIVCAGELPSITNKKSSEKYSKKLIEILVKNEEECTRIFNSAIKIIEEVGIEDRDVVRTPAYTKRIADCCRLKFLSSN